MCESDSRLRGEVRNRPLHTNIFPGQPCAVREPSGQVRIQAQSEDLNRKTSIGRHGHFWKCHREETWRGRVCTSKKLKSRQGKDLAETCLRNAARIPGLSLESR